MYRPPDDPRRESVRLISVLAEHLPPESATGRRLGGRAALTLDEQILRDIRHGQALQMHQAAGKKGKSPPKAPEDPPTYEKRKADQLKINANIARYQAKRERFMARSRAGKPAPAGA